MHSTKSRRTATKQPPRPERVHRAQVEQLLDVGLVANHLLERGDLLRRRTEAEKQCAALAPDPEGDVREQTPTAIDAAASGTSLPVALWSPTPASASTRPTTAAESSNSTVFVVGSVVLRANVRRG
jgi:hypothetical protein